MDGIIWVWPQCGDNPMGFGECIGDTQYGGFCVFIFNMLEKLSGTLIRLLLGTKKRRK